jgi:glycosyltransferase involved in cell wall biosynthesis
VSAGPPSVLMVLDSLDVGGAERHVIALSSLLAARGHDVRIACSAGGSLEGEAAEVGIAVTILGGQLVKRRVSGFLGDQLGAELEARPVDVVHAHSYSGAAAARMALACPAGTDHAPALVVTDHSEGCWRGPDEEAIWRQVLGGAQRVIAVSEAIERRLLEVDGLPRHVVAQVSNALFLAPAGSRRPHPGAATVGVVARLRPEKGVGVFLRAAAAVVARRGDVRFIVVGDGPERASLELLAGRLGLVAGDRLRFLGGRTEGPQLVAGFDIVVVPSVANEGTPLVVLEALAAGVPLVASRTGGIPEQVRDGVDGILVPPGDAGALAAALIGVLDDPEAARRRAESAARDVYDRFSARGMADAVEAVYQAALACRSGAPR